jgi:hypothetical protein
MSHAIFAVEQDEAIFMLETKKELVMNIMDWMKWNQKNFQ